MGSQLLAGVFTVWANLAPGFISCPSFLYIMDIDHTIPYSYISKLVGIFWEATVVG